MRVQVLGALTITAGDAPATVPNGRMGQLLRQLLVVPGAVVAADTLTEALWPGHGGSDATRRLQVVVSRLRQLLDRLADSTGTLRVEHRSGGYRLIAEPPSAIDRLEFEALAGRALAERSPELVAEALALWNGEPYTGFELCPDVERERGRLRSMRRELVDAKLDLIDEQGLSPASRRAKFRRPVLDADALLPRKRLVDAAPRAGTGGVLAVSAPAGFGKSAFLSLWAERQPVPVAWVNLDDADNDPARFWAGVVGALIESGHRDVESLGSGALPPGTSAYLGALIEIAGQPANQLALVLDDVHVITNDIIRDQLVGFLSALPASAVVGLASRSPLDFVGRAGLPLGTVRRVGARQLRFTAEEVRLLVGQADGADRLWKVTEGWPIAVAALRAAGPEPELGTVDDLLTELVDHVLANAPPGVDHVLMRVAYLDRFSLELCEHLAPGEPARAAIDWLTANQLAARAGTSGGWFRLHPLFAPELLRRAESDPSVDAVGLQWRAAEWFLGQGLPEDALRYAVASGDRARVAAAAPQVLLEAALRQEFLVCTGWLEAIEPDHLGVDTRGHSIATCLASLWSLPPVRRRWADSRRRLFGGADDLVLLFHDGTAAVYEGRASEAVACLERVAEEAERYAADHAPDLGPILTGLARSKLIEAKLFHDTLRADDQTIRDVVSRMRNIAPAVATYTLPYWSLSAFVEGEYDMAAELAHEYFQARRLHDPGRVAAIDNSLPGALAAAQRARRPDELAALARGVEDLVEWYTRLGMFTSTALTHLVAAALLRAGGHHAAATSHKRRANVLLATMPDVPFIHRFATCVDEIVSARQPSGRGLLGQLTDREREVLGWLATDLSVSDIARGLHLSHGTVSNRVMSIYRKLGVSSRHSALLKVGIENVEPPAGSR